MVMIIQAVYVIVDTQQAIDVQGFNQKTRRGRGVGPLLSCKIKFKSCFFYRRLDTLPNFYVVLAKRKV